MSIAKTVSHSPLRPNAEKATLRNALNNPWKAKWFALPQTAADQIRELLESSLCGLKDVFSAPHSVRKARRSRKRKASSRLGEESEESAEPSAKRTCTVENPSSLAKPPPQASLQEPDSLKSSTILKEPNEKRDSSSELSQDPLATADEKSNTVVVSDEAKARKLELVVGVNAVTRKLEQGGLRAGLVCSTSPEVLCQHILPLAATREVPFAPLPDLSKTLARLLGIKRAMCVGWKKGSNSSNRFDDLTSAIASLAHPISLPWLAAEEEPEKEEGVSDNDDSGDVKERLSLSPLLTGHVATAMQEKGGGSRKVGVVSSPQQQAKSKPPLSPLLTGHVAVAKQGKVGRKVGVVYSPLQVKRTKVVPNAKKRRRGKRS